MKLKRIGIDLAKYVFQVHGVDAAEQVVVRKRLTRGQMLRFFVQVEPTLIGMEACGSAHYWARELMKRGHTVKLIPPQYVKPFVKRGKNDRNDAEAISEAAARPGMRSVPIKTAERQADAMLLSVRELLVGQRTQLVNALRGHAAEFGLVTRTGAKGVTQLLTDAAGDPALPKPAADALALLGGEIDRLEVRLVEIDTQLMTRHKETSLSQMLAEVPGIGPISALSLVLRVDPGQFQSGRHLASWLGLTPRDHSTGGKQRLGGISRAGNERLRQLLVLGATAVIRHAKPGRASAWLLALLERRPRKLAAVALANKMARIVWAMMTSGEAYRQPKPVAG